MARVMRDLTYCVPQKGYPYLRDCILPLHITFTLMRVTCTLYINQCITTSLENISTDKSETMRFTDHAQTTLSHPPNPLESTFMLADTTDRVDGFFSRPQRIASFEWTPGVNFHETIDPWSLFFTNNKVTERLSNFAYLRAKLHVRIMINSTKFYYGRMMASYTPMHLNDNITAFRPGVQEDFMEASQRPCVIMDPTSDQVGEMEFPFMYPKSAVSIPAKEWDRLGSLTLADLTVLRNANNAIDAVTVTVFCWATQVDYSQPTSNIYSNEGGEYYDGPVSKPAHSIARFANHLANVPVIGIYARATEMVASAGAAVARLFGFSRPTVVEPEHLYTPYYGKRLAVTNVEDTADPLSLDIKKEIPIDPRVCGMDGTDHMAFVPLAKRETYITSFDWSPGDAPDAFLYNLHVSPTQRSYETNTAVHTTPAAWICSLFKYWRGTMKLRFEVVCSSFHRGRLRLVYDPLTQATDEYNVNYTHVMDLSNETDYTMSIGWASNLPYLIVDHLNSGNPSHSSNRFTARIGNGILSVFVVNSLTTPSDTPDPVTINVYAAMCDDFEVQDPIGSGLERLSVDENVLFPPNIIPTDPPTGALPTPNVGVRGPLTLDDFVQQTTGPFILSLPNQVLTNNPDAYVLGGTDTTQLWGSPPGYVLRLNNLEDGPNDISLTFRTNSPTPPADLVIDSVPTPWTSNPGDVWTIDFTDSPTILSGVFGIPITWSETSLVLILDDSEVSRDRAVGLNRAPDPSFVVGSGNATLQEDQFGFYYRMDPGSVVIIQQPGEQLTDIIVRGNPLESVRVGDVVTQVRSIDVPTRAVPQFPPISTPSVEVENLTNGPLRLYAYSWSTTVFRTEGAEEQEVQPDRPEIIENAAGMDVNLPQVSDVFFGEVPSSFRQVMKRYTLIRNLAVVANERRLFTLYANPRNTGRGQVRPADASVWVWVMAPYLGWKGSTRHKLISDSASSIVATITRNAAGAFQESEAIVPPNQEINIGWEGSTTAFMSRQVAEAVIPWYSNLRFRNCRIGNPDLTYSTAPAFNVGLYNGASDATVRQVAAGGEDYSLHFWVSTPIVNIA